MTYGLSLHADAMVEEACLLLPEPIPYFLSHLPPTNSPSSRTHVGSIN